MTGSDREENRFRSEIKRVLEATKIHPDLVGIPEGAAVDCIVLTKVGVSTVTDLVYKFLLQELNDNSK